MDNRGTCLTDNQGNPLPTVGGTCDLSLMHLSAQGIEIPDAGAVYGMGMQNSTGLDWEFYQINPQTVAGAQPASQNDFYGSLYSIAQANLNQAYNIPTPAPVIIPAPPCNCNGAAAAAASPTNNWAQMNVTNKSFIGMAALWTLLIVLVIGFNK